MMPREGKFEFEFEKGKPWMHEDLIAPFSFAIEKTPEEIEQEKEEIKQNFSPYYIKNPEVKNEAISELKQNIETGYNENRLRLTKDLPYYETKALRILDKVYNKGYIEIPEQAADNQQIIVITKKVAEETSLSNFYTKSDVRDLINEELAKDSTLKRSFFLESIIQALEPNIKYDEDLSKKKLEENYNKISLTRGLVQEGEKIISKGNIVTPEKYLILMSLRKEYEVEVAEGSSQYIILTGYALLIIFIFVIFISYINFFRKDVMRSTKSIILIMLNILLFIFLTTYISNNEFLNIFLIPYAIVPIILIALFGPRIAIMTHLVIILISSLFVANGLDFFFLQILTGFMAVISMSKIRYLSQFFVASLLIALTYYVNFIGIKFVQVGSLKDIEWANLLWFSGNFVLTLLAYPLIYAFEKIFGFVSDISLMEYADINKKLLRKLAMKAPGTFQHSLQVANLAETVLNEIGGNSLLARVGALYHDIGKMDKPQYFIENQKYIDNPHNELTDEESAKIIIEHVTKGIEIANEQGLPEEIIKFIRTHHGTSRVEYFYRNYLKNKPIENVDESKFRYPGPKPFSKETAVVMLVDSVEAASRSLREPDEEKLDSLIDSIIDNKVSDNQLENADITMREINIVRARLKKLLKSIYHIRIEYPKKEENISKQEAF